ncbi:hypothetical protein U9M48_012402 [Paspalum notatum var. saurae]|uniref:Chromatin assembly factor 1 subunit Cac1-like C-terminal domain-containing protein n=1 Tax=Paspalum notatum var. saurae TaxID=547442 RepID=A0AAQ3SXD6_PASNO
MKKYHDSPIIDVPNVVNMAMEDQEFCPSNKKSPRIPLPSKSISDSDMPEFVKLITSCHQGMRKLVELLQEKFPHVSKVQLKSRVREIAEFTNNHCRLRKISWISTGYLLQVQVEAQIVQHLFPSSHWMNRANQVNLLLSPAWCPKRAHNKWVCKRKEIVALHCNVIPEIRCHSMPEE